MTNYSHVTVVTKSIAVTIHERSRYSLERKAEIIMNSQAMYKFITIYKYLYMDVTT